jgi:Na+-driven multidrug efflux pump
LKKGFSVSLVGSAGVALAAAYLLPAFTGDPAVIAGAVTLQRLGVFLETGRVFNMVGVNGLRATGDARFPLLMGICIMWGVWVPLAWLLSLHFQLGLAGICLAMIADEWTRGLLNLGRWTRGGWIKHAERSRAGLLRSGI